jgi:hypothetical protein
MFYFAYCTLLDTNEMGRFVPGARPGAVGTIDDWRVGFAAHSADGGGCQLFRSPQHRVHGLLYELTDEEMDQLDTISGVPLGLYRRINVDVATADDTVPAITYVIPSPLGDFQPSASYVRPILAGARTLGLPEPYIEELEATVGDARAGATDA